MQTLQNRQSSSRRYLNVSAGALAALILVTACQNEVETAQTADNVTVGVEAAPADTLSAMDPVEAASLSTSTSSERNLATALLMQWWDLFEAPEGVDRSALIDTLFAEDVVLHMEAGDLEGIGAVRAAVAALPPTLGRSHHLHTVDLAPLGDDLYALEATFQYHIAHLDGSVEAGESAYHHKLRKTSDGAFVLAEISAEVLEPLSDVSFVPSYQLNKARGALAYYLGTSDVLQEAYPGLKSVLADRAEIHGMFDPSKQTFNDRGDGVLIGYDEISPWLASRAENFTAVAHTISAIEITEQDGNLIKLLAQMDVQAWPKSGDTISVSLPIKLEMTDTGEAFLRINRIDR